MQVVYVNAEGQAKVVELSDKTKIRVSQVTTLLDCDDFDGTMVTPTIQMVVPLTTVVSAFPAMFEGIDPETKNSVSLTDQQVQAILALLATG